MEYVRELDTRAAGTAATQSALKVHRLTFMEAAMLVVGSTIGSDVLGLAYASRLAGWPVPFVWLVVAGIFSGISMLYVAETALRTQEPLQLSGLAEKYVGRIGSWLIFFSVGATFFAVSLPIRPAVAGSSASVRALRRSWPAFSLLPLRPLSSGAA